MPNDAGVMIWTRADNEPWPQDALARLLAWADAGLPCQPPTSPPTPGVDGGPASADTH
jgi:hypothetical protein